MKHADFPTTRAEALARLETFVPRAGRDYAALRNHDLAGHPHVSQLSPYIRHRMLTEEEVLSAVLNQWSPSTAEKFIQEVVWRSYFKGWLELRPDTWRDYRAGVDAAWNRLQTESGLRSQWEVACSGQTGIDAFDHWARELVETGYLHNHARMWFASIWIFALKLPWELGADFFLRHLLDGDAASNTLGWRWVAGLHTRGKNYVATPDNIQKYTRGRFRLTKLDTSHVPLSGPEHPEPRPLRDLTTIKSGCVTCFLTTEDDLSFDLIPEDVGPVGAIIVSGAKHRSPLSVSTGVQAFTQEIIGDASKRSAKKVDSVTTFEADRDLAASLSNWMSSRQIEQIVMPYLAQGPARDGLQPALKVLARAGISIVERRREYDERVWPLCTAGFFKVKRQIPALLRDMRLS